MPKVIVTASRFLRGNQEALKSLTDAGIVLEENAYHPQRTDDEMIDMLWEAGAAIVGLDPFTEKVFAALPNFKAVCRMGVGYDTVDVEAATRHGVVVCTTRGSNHHSVADFAFGLMLAVARNIPAFDRTVREHRWDRRAGVEVWGKTIGIIGTGLIGRGVALRARGFNMRVLGYDIKPDGELAQNHGVTYVGLEELLRESDFVTLHCDLNRETRGLIGEAQLRLMKPSAYLINTCRGPVVQEQALCRALEEGWIAGAGIDVYEREPLPDDSQLRNFDSIVLAPHGAGGTAESLDASTRIGCENIGRILAGRKPLYCVNPETVAHLAD